MYSYKEPKEGLPQVPMNEAERSYIKTIFDKRLSILMGAISILSVIALLSGPISWTGKKMHRTYKADSKGYKNFRDSYDYTILGYELTDTELYWLIHGSMLLVINGGGLAFFFRRVYPYYKDLKLGMKERVSYTIIRKSYFPATRQYYFSFDNPDYMHYEVHADIYNSMDEGDTVVIYRAKYSNQVFEKDARFTIM